MDKYEYKVRAEEIKKLIDQGEYAQAAEIADTIDWRRVKSVMMLCTISDLYKINRRFEDARDMMLLAYDRRPGGRNICYALCDLSIKLGDLVHAMEYYKEFVQVAPRDAGRYILQYKLYEDQDVSLEERIAVLEELKRHEYREKWAYELAYLYHRVGLATKCVEECDELIAFFGEGEYVIKAMELKMLHQPLTEKQQEVYDARLNPVEESVPEQEAEEEDDSVWGAETDQDADSQDGYVTSDTQIYDASQLQQQPGVSGAPVDEEDIQVKTLDMGQFNTINLQAELEEGVKAYFQAEAEKSASEKSEAGIADPITRSIVAPMYGDDTESLDAPEIDEVDEDDLEPVEEQMESSEVFFGETGEIVMDQMRRENLGPAPVVEELVNRFGEEDAAAAWEEEERKKEEDAQKNAPVESTPEKSIPEESIPEENTLKSSPVHKMTVVEPPKEMAGVLSQEADGQISLVVPERENVEKQITGQMNIEEVLAEWERMKKENEEKRREEVRQHVLQQTGSMFTEFEAKVRDGLLEKLEKGETETEAEPETEPGTEGETEAEAEPETEPETEGETEAEAEPETQPESEPESLEDHSHRLTKTRSMTREERELYSAYISSASTKEQIVNAVDHISLAAYTGNVIITGEAGMDTITLAKNMIRELQYTDSNFSGKVAKISGQGLNRKEMEDILNQLQNGALIIQNACGMNEDTVQNLYKGLQKESFGIVVILQDEQHAMEQFLEAYPVLREIFTAQVNVEALSNDMLVAYGRKYAKEKEYAIDELGALALHHRIEELGTLDHAVTLSEVEEIVDEAIARANRKTPRHFFDILFAKRYDEEDMIVVTERDFA